MDIEEYPRKTVVREEPVVRSRLIRDDGYRDTRFSLVYYILNIVEVLLAIRLLLKLFGANAANGFVNAMYTITNPLVQPFTGIFHNTAASTSVLEWSTVVAMIVYALIAYLIVMFLRAITRTARMV